MADTRNALADFSVEELSRLRHSFVLLIPRIDAIAGSFYARLFQDFPSVRVHFEEDLELQRKKFVDSIASLLDLLDRPAIADRVMGDLGVKHIGYGATDEIYLWVKTAFPVVLLESLSKEELLEDPSLYMELWPRFISHAVDSMNAAAKGNRA